MEDHMRDPKELAEDFRKSIGVIHVPQNPALISDSVAAPTEGSKANVAKRSVSYTDADPKRVITGEIIVGTHVYQPPLVDGLKTVGNITKALVDGVFNFQQTNYRSWFGLHPQLIIRSELEFVETGSTVLDDAALAMGYKKLASRAANRVYHYLEAMKLLTSAMYNMANIARFEGDTVLKNFASDLRSSRLNTILGNAAKYPVPKGLYDQIKATAIYLSGVTPDGVPVISIPRIDVSVFGNRAVHCNTPSNFVSLSGTDKIDPKKVTGTGDPVFMKGVANGTIDKESLLDDESESQAFFDLMSNVESTIYHFAGGKKRFAIDEAQTAKGEGDANLLKQYEIDEAVKYAYDFRGPVTINGTSVNVGSDGNFNASARLNGHGPLLLDNWVGDFNLKYEFTQLVMNQAFEIMRYVEENFHDFGVIGNDWYKLVVDDLKLCEPSGIRISKMISDARGMKYGDINEFLDVTKTKRDSNVSCSGIVKYMPVIGDPTNGGNNDVKGLVGDFTAPYDYIVNNFERFDFSFEDPQFTLRQAKRVPRFNPTLFFVESEGDVHVFAGNTGPNFASSTLESVKNDDTPIKVDHSLMANGQRALFDYTRVVQNDPSISRVRFSGVTPDVAKEIVDADTFATVYTEDKTQLFVDSLPAVDHTDLYANGFSILFFNKGQFPSMIARELMDADNFVADDAEKHVPTRGIISTGGIPTGLAPLSPSVEKSAYTADDGGVAATQASPEFLRAHGCYEGYVGAGILSIPSEVAMLTPTGTFVTCDKIEGKADAELYRSAVGKSGTGVTVKPASTDGDEGGIVSFKMGMCPLTVHKTVRDYLSDNNLRNSNLNVIDLLEQMQDGATDSYVMYKFANSETGRIRFNTEASPLDGFRQLTEGLLPGDLDWTTAAVKLRLGQLHNGVDNTNEDSGSIDPILDGMMPGEWKAISKSDACIRQMVSAVPRVDSQAIRYSDYPYVAYEGEHFLGKEAFLLKIYADTEVTAVGTKNEQYLLDCIGKEMKDNYIAPVTGKYTFTSNHYVAEVFVKVNSGEYAARGANSGVAGRSGELKTVHFSADTTGKRNTSSSRSDTAENPRYDKERSARKKRHRGKRLTKSVNTKGNESTGNGSSNHMGKEMEETVGKASTISEREAVSIKDAGARGEASYTASNVT